MDIPKTEVESATIRNQESACQGEEQQFQSEVLESNGAGEWNRTTDLRFTKPLLCQLSYAGFLHADSCFHLGKASYSDGFDTVNAHC